MDAVVEIGLKEALAPWRQYITKHDSRVPKHATEADAERRHREDACR